MQPAADVMAKALSEVSMRAPVVPLIANVTAQATSSVEDIRNLLVQQVTGSVRWRESVLFMKEQGVTNLVECGIGNVLAGLARRIDKELVSASVHTPEEIEAFLKSINA